MRTSASGRPRATGRRAIRPGRPGGPTGHAAGCRSGGTRGVRSPGRRAHPVPRPRRVPRRSVLGTWPGSVRIRSRRRPALPRPSRTGGNGRCPTPEPPSPGARGTPGSRPAGCRHRGRPCSWRPSPSPSGPPARRSPLPSRGSWRSRRCAGSPGGSARRTVARTSRSTPCRPGSAGRARSAG